MLVIDPDECTGCGVCVDECPVSAIFPEEDVPEKWESYIELNGRLSVIWPEIDQRREPMADAEKYGSIVSKRDLLDESPGEGS
jgi:ferredoxin